MNQDREGELATKQTQKLHDEFASGPFPSLPVHYDVVEVAGIPSTAIRLDWIVYITPSYFCFSFLNFWFPKPIEDAIAEE
ncbi:hypothetical protein J6590_013853 [Homalodisca vitripennis]|nr:hypothetical protein J6590_013853 [Homalodisca vitripennis]